jgi:hypothetical protein
MVVSEVRNEAVGGQQGAGMPVEKEQQVDVARVPDAAEAVQ